MYDWSHWSCSCWRPSTFFSMTTNTALWVLDPQFLLSSSRFLSSYPVLVRLFEYRFPASTFPYRHVLFTESTCSLFRSLFRFPFSYAISIRNSRSRFLYLGSQSSVSCLSIPVFQLFDCSSFRPPDSGLSLFSASFLYSMYLDIPDGYAGWLLRHLKSKPLRLYSSILVLILCSFLDYLCPRKCLFPV